MSLQPPVSCDFCLAGAAQPVDAGCAGFCSEFLEDGFACPLEDTKAAAFFRQRICKRGEALVQKPLLRRALGPHSGGFLIVHVDGDDRMAERGGMMQGGMVRTTQIVTKPDDCRTGRRAAVFFMSRHGQVLLSCCSCKPRKEGMQIGLCGGKAIADGLFPLRCRQ